MTLVPDASVVVKWFVPEVHSAAARTLLDAGHEFVAPDLLFSEVANTLWKKSRRREITADEAGSLLKDVLRVPLDVVSGAELVSDALEIAVRTERSVDDATYLALAARLDTVLVTADDRLVDGLRAFPLLAPHVVHVTRVR